MHKFARMERLPPYVFAVVNELKMQMRRQGEDVIDLGMGNPDLPTPTHIVDKLVEAARKGVNHRYSASRGIKGLRNAISGWYKRRFDVDIDPETEAVVTMGAKEGLAHLALVMLSPGDVVFATDPAYPIHPYSCIIAGADVRRIPVAQDRDFFEDLLVATRQTWPPAQASDHPYPQNPTTAVADIAFFERIVEFAKEHQMYVIHDFAYADFGYDGYLPPSFLQAKGAKDVAWSSLPDQELSMAGWRWASVAATRTWSMRSRASRSYLDYGIFQPIQIAATVALNGPQECVREIMDEHQVRRDTLIQGLHRIGWEVPPPKATMFVWAKIPEAYAHMGSVEFSKLLLREGQVAVSPGLGFGHFGDTHVRFALVENQHRIKTGRSGLKKVLSG
jgi:alanine-synthesizing transaminase